MTKDKWEHFLEFARRAREEERETVKTLHFKYFRHPVTKKWMSPIARWSETGMVRRG